MSFDEWEAAWLREIEQAKARRRARHVMAILGAATVAGVVLAAGLLAVYSLGPNIMP
jgi:formate/nitrite transporter FocA (FNT family)